MKKETRRNFIQKATFGATALTAGISNAFAKDLKPEFRDKQTPLKLGLMTYLLGSEWDIDTLINNCKETGFQHVSLRTSHNHGVELSLSKKERGEVKNKFENSYLESISLASAFSYHHTDPVELKKNIEGTKEYLQLAADVGAIGVRVFPDAFPEGVSRENTMRQIGQSLREVGEFGHNLGVEVWVEMHGSGTGHAPVTKEILDYSNSKHVYVIWNCMESDTEGAGLEGNFDMVKDRIRHVHMHELTSDYPYGDLFRLLRESGYQGYCSAEIFQPTCEPIRLMHYYRTLFLALQNECNWKL